MRAISSLGLRAWAYVRDWAMRVVAREMREGGKGVEIVGRRVWRVWRRVWSIGIDLRDCGLEGWRDGEMDGC